MRRLLVDARLVTLDEAILIEPTIEALYYKHAPCEILLYAESEALLLFANHPLVKTLVPAENHAAYVERDGGIGPGETVLLETNSIHYVSSVEAYAYQARVLLSRRTPWIHVPSRPKDTNRIVIQGGVDGLEPLAGRLQPSGAEIVVLGPNVSVQDALTTMSSASLVVGLDSWITRAAAAMNLRVVAAMTEDEEKFLRPVNVTIADLDFDDVLHKVRELWKEKRYPDYLNSGNMTDFIKLRAKEYMKDNFLDVGANKWPLVGATPVDLDRRGPLDNAEPNSISGIYSSHCLEHIVEWEPEVRLWHKVLRPHGVLFLYLPHPQCEPWHAWTGSWVGQHHVWNPEPVTLAKFLTEKLNFNILEYSSRPDALWSFHLIARKRA